MAKDGDLMAAMSSEGSYPSGGRSSNCGDMRQIKDPYSPAKNQETSNFKITLNTTLKEKVQTIATTLIVFI